MYIGLDFGTTNSGAAVFDGQHLHLFALDPANWNPAVLRSTMYVTRDQVSFIGQEAVDHYYRENTRRPSKLVRRYVGEVELTLAETTTIWPTVTGSLFREVYVLVDEMLPGRLLHSLKSALATGYEGTTIFDRYYTLEQLLAIYLQKIKLRVETQLGQTVDGVVIGRPVRFLDSSGEEQDSHAEERLRQAARTAGFRDVVFELEPVAAALHFAQSLSSPQNVMVFDFGGGTLDITIMRVGSGTERHIFATGGVGIAGDTFDRRIIEHFLLDHFGKGTTWGEDGAPFPNSYLDALLHWERIPQLLRPETLQFLELAQRTGSDPRAIRALESLLVNDLALALFEAVEKAKIALSTAVFTTIRLDDEDIDIWQPVSRSQFEVVIAEASRLVEECVVAVVARSGLAVSEIDTVVRTGGSAQIPYFVAMLERLFGPEKVVQTDTFSSVTSGLAIRAHEIASS
jgi:hypothetical chaperone protein